MVSLTTTEETFLLGLASKSSPIHTTFIKHPLSELHLIREIFRFTKIPVRCENVPNDYKRNCSGAILPKMLDNLEEIELAYCEIIPLVTDRLIVTWLYYHIWTGIYTLHREFPNFSYRFYLEKKCNTLSEALCLMNVEWLYPY
jgi:hypothetical protein